MKKWIVVLGLIICNFCFCVTVDAAPVTDYGRFDMRVSPNRAAGRTFHTSLGELRIEFLNITQNSEAERCHMNGYLNGEQIINVYWPKPDDMYYLRIFEDAGIGRLYIGMQTKTRLRVLAYDKRGRTLKKVIDSIELDSAGGTGPVIGVKEGELVLLFTVPDGTYGRRYKCIWRPTAGRFKFDDITKERPYYAPPAEYEPEQSDNEEVEVKQAEVGQAEGEDRQSTQDSLLEPDVEFFVEEDYPWIVK